MAYKPFTKTHAYEIASKLQSEVGKKYSDGNLTFSIETVSMVSATKEDMSFLQMEYFKTANGAVRYKDLADYLTAYKGSDFDVVAFCKAPNDGGFSTSVVPVSIIGVSEEGPEYGFIFLK